MKEVVFIRKNIDKWRETEELVDKAGNAHPDELADTYTDLTADLAFSQTHFPYSRITIYLNNLCSALHNILYRNKREKWSRILAYWRDEVPVTMAGARKELFSSFLVFCISAIIGVVSALNDDSFVRLILGDQYVDMTLRNIEAGRPLAVYGSFGEVGMFLGITINNVRVAFMAFASGIFTSFATGFILFRNGVMLGSFFTMFFQHDVLREAMLTVWLHGTLEIWVIIVAGAAGIALGNGWLFPGTYSRGVSFARGARKGLKIVIGVVPVFIMAGFIEGFITRHTGMSDWVKMTIIILSLVFIVYYYIILPKQKIKKSCRITNYPFM